jgi:hypothetical protein
MMVRRNPLRVSLVAAGLAVAGCGSASTVTAPKATVTRAAAAATTAASTSSAAPPPPPPRLRIVAPRHDFTARDGTVVVRVAVLGGHGHVGLRYVVDRRRSQNAARRFVVRDLAPGHHHLLVMLAGDRGVHASTMFAVRKPPPPPPPPLPPMHSVPPTMNAPAPMMGSSMG